MTKSKTLGILACVLVFIMQTSCSGQSVPTQSHFESEKSNTMIEPTAENIIANTAPEIKISLKDGAVLTHGIGESKEESRWAEEQSEVHVKFLNDMPDNVSVTLTPFYSGGSVRILDPVSVVLTKTDQSTYSFYLPLAFEYTPSLFYFLEYQVIAQYQDISYTYNFTIQIECATQTQIETDANGIPQGIPPIAISYEKGQSTIAYASAKNQWNGIALKRESLFLPERNFGGVFSHHHMMPDNPTQLILADFTPYPPDEVIVTEHIFLMGEEQKAYWGETNSIASTQVSEGIYEFTAELTNDGNVGFMGYSMTAKWGENICEYAFLFNTRVRPEDCD